ncbi:MAG: hypothetical protein JO035_06385 [Betaproteobacteria bacterium]|nr:hypothetical protein [Betaproteobacteria bacterium]
MADVLSREERGELLFSYAAGTLDDAARRGVEALLDADPGLRNELAWYEAVCDGVIESLPEPRALPSADDIVDRIGPKRAQAAAPFWRAWLAPAAGALIVVQAVAIGWLASERRETQLYRSAASSRGEAKAVVFVVAFQPETPEAKVRALLVKAGATIVDGPKQMGDYHVAVPANRAQYAQQLFQDSGITEYVRRQE